MDLVWTIDDQPHCSVRA